MIKIGTSKYSSGMGDVLLLTSLCKHLKNVKVELYPNAAKYKIFFDNICDSVEISENATVTPDIPPGHFSQQKLRYFGLSNVCYLPYLHPKPEYFDIGKNLIKNYHNPIAFVSNCNINQKARDIPKEYAQTIVDELSKKHTVLQFGLSNNLTKLNNTIPILDLSIYDLICYYSAIKNFVGADTGDSHLMIALGGKCSLIVPSDRTLRNPDWWNYKNYSNITYTYF